MRMLVCRTQLSVGVETRLVDTVHHVAALCPALRVLVFVEALLRTASTRYHHQARRLNRLLAQLHPRCHCLANNIWVATRIAVLEICQRKLVVFIASLIVSSNAETLGTHMLLYRRHLLVSVETRMADTVHLVAVLLPALRVLVFVVALGRTVSTWYHHHPANHPLNHPPDLHKSQVQYPHEYQDPSQAYQSAGFIYYIAVINVPRALCRMSST